MALRGLGTGWGPALLVRATESTPARPGRPWLGEAGCKSSLRPVLHSEPSLHSDWPRSGRWVWSQDSGDPGIGLPLAKVSHNPISGRPGGDALRVPVFVNFSRPSPAPCVLMQYSPTEAKRVRFGVVASETLFPPENRTSSPQTSPVEVSGTFLRSCTKRGMEINRLRFFSLVPIFPAEINQLIFTKCPYGKL